MRKNPIAQVCLAAAREAVNIDAPAVAEKPLERRRAEDQQGIMKQRQTSIFGVQRGIDAALDQPGKRDAGQISGDQRQDAEENQPAIALDEKLDAVVIAKNFSILWFAVRKTVLPHCGFKLARCALEVNSD